MVALVATIHVFAPERPGEQRFAGRRPLASQDVDARDKPEHDGEGAATPLAFSRMGEGGAERRNRACRCWRG
jgi:hypothetical protein